jgi:hypothetical protein
MSNNNQDSELYRSTQETIKSLFELMKDIKSSSETMGKAQQSFEDSKNNKWIELLKIISPIVLLIIIFVLVRFLPCETSIDIGAAKINAAPCHAE